MSTITATEAKKKFGEVLDMAQSEPVHVQKNGRDVAVVLSSEEYQRLTAAGPRSRINPRLEELMTESMEKRRSVYEALAK